MIKYFLYIQYWRIFRFTRTFVLDSVTTLSLATTSGSYKWAELTKIQRAFCGWGVLVVAYSIDCTVCCATAYAVVKNIARRNIFQRASNMKFPVQSVEDPIVEPMPLNIFLQSGNCLVCKIYIKLVCFIANTRFNNIYSMCASWI